LFTFPPQGELPIVLCIHTILFAILFATVRTVSPTHF
jgi:hypothetical protein